MSARLKRLEGMVRDMMDNEGDQIKEPAEVQPGMRDDDLMKGKVVKGGMGGLGTRYVGATHAMAILEDVCAPFYGSRCIT